MLSDLAAMVVAWFGGLGPGLFATALALPVVNYLFLDTAYSFKIDTSRTTPQATGAEASFRCVIRQVERLLPASRIGTTEASKPSRCAI